MIVLVVLASMVMAFALISPEYGVLAGLYGVLAIFVVCAFIGVIKLILDAGERNAARLERMHSTTVKGMASQSSDFANAVRELTLTQRQVVNLLQRGAKVIDAETLRLPSGERVTVNVVDAEVVSRQDY